MIDSVGYSGHFRLPALVAFMIGVMGFSAPCLGAENGEGTRPPTDRATKQILQGALLGAGVSLVVAGFIVDDREPQRKMYREDGEWQYLTLFPAEESSWGDQKSLWVAGSICFGCALVLELGDRFGSRVVDESEESGSLGLRGFHLESAWLGSGMPGVGLAAGF